MAASGAMWAKPGGGKGTGKHIVITKAELGALGMTKADVKAKLASGQLTSADLAQAKGTLTPAAKPAMTAAAGKAHDLTPESGLTVTHSGNVYTQGGLHVQQVDGKWKVVHTGTNQLLDKEGFDKPEDAVKLMGDLNGAANWKFVSKGDVEPGQWADLKSKAKGLIEQAHTPAGPTQHTMTLTKKNGQKVDVTGELENGLLVHKAINQGGWEITQAATGKHVAHAVDEATAKKVASTLADDPEVGAKLAAGDTGVLQAANEKAHLVKHNQYVKPVPPPPPIDQPAPTWSVPHQTFSSYHDADTYLAQAFAGQYQGLHLTSAESGALSSYQGSGYGSINGAVWGGGSSSKATQIDSLMQKVGGAPTNMTIVRAESSGHKLYSQAAKLEVGDPYVSLGFDSTHSASASGWNWTASSNTGVRIYYRVPQGTPMVHMNSLPHYHSSHHGEGEVLLGRNLAWKVVGKRVSPQAHSGSPKIELTVELIGQLTTSEAASMYQASMSKPKAV